jgi:pimeloyl-ACP methyl ester carboxylesterase
MDTRRFRLVVEVFVPLIVASVVLMSTATARGASLLRSDVAVVNGVSIHYLDSGGPKPALLFIPGLGDTAYMMEGFGARFTGTNRVVIMTRRGFGQSGLPRDGYDLGSRVEDIRALLDSLKLQKVVLVGHSIAGDELTAFATKYPTRLISLIYLDAAYDRTDPETPQPTSAVWGNVLVAWVGNSEISRTSLDRYRAAQQRTFFGVWSVSQERNLQETVVVNVDGTISSRTPSWVAQAISAADKDVRLPLAVLNVPALLVFARQRLEQRGLALDDNTKAGLMRDEGAYEAYFSKYLSSLKKQTNLQIVVMNQTMHHLYLEKPAEVERVMRTFLEVHGAS